MPRWVCVQPHVELNPRLLWQVKVGDMARIVHAGGRFVAKVAADALTDVFASN
jgi:hypothetical protein